MHASLREEGTISIGGWIFQVMHVTASLHALVRISGRVTCLNYWDATQELTDIGI